MHTELVLGIIGYASAPKNIKRKIDEKLKQGHKFGWVGVEV
jgi:hypothetical protein